MAKTVDFGSWTREEMLKLFAKMVREMTTSEVVDVLKQEGILDEDGNLN